MSNLEVLQKGHKYNIYFNDVVIAGSFRGTFERFINSDDEEVSLETVDSGTVAVFDVGIIGYLWWADIKFEEIYEQ